MFIITAFGDIMKIFSTGKNIMTVFSAGESGVKIITLCMRLILPSNCPVSTVTFFGK